MTIHASSTFSHLMAAAMATMRGDPDDANQDQPVSPLSAWHRLMALKRLFEKRPALINVKARLASVDSNGCQSSTAAALATPVRVIFAVVTSVIT